MQELCEHGLQQGRAKGSRRGSGREGGRVDKHKTKVVKIMIALAAARAEREQGEGAGGGRGECLAYCVRTMNANEKSEHSECSKLCQGVGPQVGRGEGRGVGSERGL